MTDDDKNGERLIEVPAPPPSGTHERPKMVPLVIDTRMLRPLPQSLYDSACSNCDKRQSRWEMGPANSPNVAFVCSICFLYESKWGEARRDQIDVLIDEVEKERGQKFLRGVDGTELINCKDADSIVASVALTSRMFQVHDTIEAVRGNKPGS
jgi:hypothetical protein